MRKAISEAKMIDDTFLKKVHPDFLNHYRYEYQKSLELKLKNFDGMDISAEIEGGQLYNKWVIWYESHKNEFRF